MPQTFDQYNRHEDYWCDICVAFSEVVEVFQDLHQIATPDMIEVLKAEIKHQEEDQ
jgi:hypothetical protein|tara:strand:- start:195 stop:362 length:168 start_codon:yes stop_codon:yes gene_type:complete